jgi:GNAT superfamily N-acetyltransferase
MYNAVHQTSTGEFQVMRLRRARLVDVASLDALIARSWRVLGRQHYTPQQVESAVRYIARADMQLIRDDTLYVITVGRQIVACGGWSKREAMYTSGRASDLLDPALHPARARSFFVDPQWTRRGLATMLMNEATLAARAAGFRQIELLATRMGEFLYNKLGYRALGQVDVELPDGVKLETMRMIRDLD